MGAHLRPRARGPVATDQAARHAGHGSRTRQRGPGVCEPGHRITNTGSPGSQTQTRPGSSCATRQPPAPGPGTRQQLRDQLGRQPPAPGTRTTDQAALGSHQAARTWQQITAAAALTWQQITARAAVSGQQITANQAARPTAQAATGSSCRARTRQQLRTIRAARFTRRSARATGQARPVARASG